MGFAFVDISQASLRPVTFCSEALFIYHKVTELFQITKTAHYNAEKWSEGTNFHSFTTSNIFNNWTQAFHCLMLTFIAPIDGDQRLHVDNIW